jgi:hypothetical protein
LRVLLFVGLLVVVLLFLWGLSAVSWNKKDSPDYNPQLVSLSGQLLLYVKTEDPTDSLEHALAKITPSELNTGLCNDIARKVFWINIYNAWFQILSARDTGDKSNLFTTKSIPIASMLFSLDEIEHGILRKYRSKFSLGYLPQFFPPSTIKQLSVSKIDYRIHFALNCGAKSCPPIAFYDYDALEDQLETAARSFLGSETEIDEATKTVRVSKIMEWFKADFGGNQGIREILSKYLEKDFSGYTIQFKEYNWDAQLKNFVPDFN